MNNKENTTELLRCLESDSTNCDDLYQSQGPEFSYNANRAKENALTREVGTPKDKVNPPGRRYSNRRPTVEQIATQNGEVTPTNGRHVSLNRTPIDSSETEDEAVLAVDEGGLLRDNGNVQDPIIANAIDAQRVADEGLTVEGGNKAFPYISPLASTNFSGLTPINPLNDASSGANGNLYNVNLLQDEGIIYLRQYLSFDDEETGAVWRFQYAPQIAYTRSSTFQEDVTWGTNVQPAHFNNTSGKKVSIQGAILEGMTIGKTVTGAVRALETLMSVVNPDNEEQIAPYAYRLIVGGRTFTEPVSGRHSPFVIENISVKEELYDTNGEVLMYKVDMSLKEVPYYQINDGRKLLLVTQDQRTRAQATCDQISQSLARLDNEVAAREKQLKDVLAEVQTRGNKETTSLSLLKTRMKQVESNCQQDSKAYSEYIELFKDYNAKKCRTSKPIRGFHIIEELFQNDSGVYEILKGRPQLQDQSIFRYFAFDENGRSVPYFEVSETIKRRVGGSNPPYEFLKSVNPAVVSSSTSKRSANVRVKSDDLIPSCQHIRCTSKNIQRNANPENINLLFDAADRLLDNPDVVANMYPGLFSTVIKVEKARIFFPKTKIDVPVNSGRQFVCTDILNASNYGYSNAGNVVKDARSEANTVFNQSKFDRERFEDSAVQAGACVVHIKQILLKTKKEAKNRNCNEKALNFGLFDQYSEYINRLNAIFEKVVAEFTSSGIPRNQLIDALEEKDACSRYISKESFLQKVLPGNPIYADGVYGSCRSAYAIVQTTNEIIKSLEDVEDLEDKNPFKDITLAK